MFLSAYYSAVIYSGNKSGYGSVDDICIDACAPEYAVLGLDTNICHSLRLGAGLKSVLLICDKGIFQTKLLLNSIGNCVQTAVAHCFAGHGLSVLVDGNTCCDAVLLYKMNLVYLEVCLDIYVLIEEYLLDLGRHKLLVSMVGNALDSIAEVLTHLRRHIYAEHLLHDVADTALAGLGVDTNNIALVFSADIHG